MLMMVLLLPGGLLGGYGGDPDRVNGSWEKASTGVSLPICVRVALATGEHAHHLAP
jgi:hypothetical protein